MVQAREDKPTIVLCVYNGRGRIGEVLDALASQRCPADSFRVVVVDNNSTDGTADYVRALPAVAQLAARGQTPRVICEARQGLMAARIAGIHAADTDVVCFLDDDNVPELDYIETGAMFFATHPDAALAVSRVRPVFEVAPPHAVLRRRHLFAVNDELGDKSFAFGPGMAPTLGAGLWLRKSVFLAVVPWRTPERMIPDRVQNQLISGNDIEIGILLGRAGHARYYAPGLRIKHKIPRTRLGTGYVTRLITGIVRSQATLDDVYSRPRGPARRLLAVAAVAGAVLAAPMIALRREDGVRDAWFVLVARVAAARGSYPDIRAKMRAAVAPSRSFLTDGDSSAS